MASVADLLHPTSPSEPTDALVVTLVDGSRVAIRPSGTESLVRVMVEAPTQAAADDALFYRARLLLGDSLPRPQR